MSSEELLSVKGGVSSTLYNTLLRFITTSFELGRTVGSIIRRAIEKDVC